MSSLPASTDVLIGATPFDTRDRGTPRFLRRLLGRPVAVICLAYLTLLVGVAIVAPLVMPWVSHQQAGDLLAARQGPTSHHLLGVDSLGRDELDRLLVGTRVTLLAIAEALVVFIALGIPFGLIAGYFGGMIDRVVSGVADVAFSIPGLIVVLVVLSVFPQNTLAGMVTLGVLASPFLMRIVRSATLPVREQQYIAAAQVSGLSRSYIISRHVMPRVTGPIIVQASLFCGAALLTQAGLAFLGLLVAPPAPSWGAMLNDGIQNIVLQPWLIWPPGFIIALTILAFGLLGDAVRDATMESWQTPARRTRRRVRRLRRPRDVRYVAETTAVRPRPKSSVRTTRPHSLLALENLCVAFPSPHGRVVVVEDVTFDVGPGETVGIVGESGCGKTVTAMAILGLLPANGEITSGRVRFDGRDLASLEEQDLRRVRGRQIGLVSQEPMVGMNPVFRVGWQIADCLRVHHRLSRREASRRAIELLARVHLSNPESVARRYPHELSGGMAQRVSIARALSGNPKLLIADEPTTALDVTVQAEILELLRELARDQGMSILLVTHDWGVVADICERAVVMYAGQVVERAEVTSIFAEPRHPYTKALLASDPHRAPESEFLPSISGVVPRPDDWPSGCRFQPRCGYATAACSAQVITLTRPSEGRETRCIHHSELALRL